MPDIDGYALAAQIRQDRMASHMPIVMMGALSEQTSQEQLEPLGIQAFLVKPIDPHEMLTVLNTLTCRTPADAATAPAAPAQMALCTPVPSGSCWQKMP